ncbi:S-layer family protein [Candidatus Obscuribacterales bacterium]|nr:S-layer family protein [Candidatus Obscuribacterales bacterium]
MARLAIGIESGRVFVRAVFAWNHSIPPPYTLVHCMNTQDLKQNWIKALDASVVASILAIGTSTAAQANPNAIPDLHTSEARASMRAERHELRQQRHDVRLENRATMMESRALRSSANIPTAASVGVTRREPNFHHINSRESTAILFPGQVSTFRTERPNQGRSTYTNDNGKSKIVTQGLSLDLSSTTANITVGQNLLTGTVSIKVGNQTKEISAGSKVTAAEFAALNQKLATGDQSLELSNRGAATGGSLNLNNVSDDGATIRASELVIPVNVSVTGDFARTADGVRVKSDIQNYGSLTAISTNANKNTAVIAARDINNESGASISSGSTASNPELNLALRADRDLNNFGNISSSGSLELTAGRAINNAGGAAAQANGSVTLNSAAITNYGSIASANGDITLTATPDAKLLVNNLAGNMSALNGAINLRESDYVGTADSIIYGGNLYSKDLNINAGQGTATVTVEDLTGKVNTTGLAAHVSTNTDTLVLGEQCLTGDPTYFNTGNIVLGGNVIVGEDLAIIAGGDITTTVPNLTIRARDLSGVAFDINIIAGANITSGSGPVSGGNLPNQSIGSITQNASTPVTINGASSTGGNIDLTGATAALGIDASTSAAGGSGGDITLAAFASAGGAKGQILTLDGTNRLFQANGQGVGANGNISVLAGATSGVAINIQDVSNFNGTGTPGNIVVSNTQPVSSNGSPITFGTNGSITSGNSLIPSSTIGGGTVTARNLTTRGSATVVGGGDTSVTQVQAGIGGLIKLQSNGDLLTGSLISIQNPNGTLRSQLTALGDITIGGSVITSGGIVVVAGGDVLSGPNGSQSLDASFAGNAGNVLVAAGANFNVNANDVTINGASATGGDVNFLAGAKIQNLRAISTGGNGNGGDLTVLAYGGAGGKGKVILPGTASVAFDVSTAANGTGINGDIAIVAGAGTADAITMGGAIARGGNTNGTGDIYISTSTPAGALTVSTAAGFGGITAGTVKGGLVTSGAGMVIYRSLVSSASTITLEGGTGGVQFGDVSLFGNFQVSSLGDILVAGQQAVVSGDAANQNTMLWTANGNISFSTRIITHATGGGTTYHGGGGGVAIVAGGTIQTIDNPITGPGIHFSDASIETTSGEDGGNITVIAGANFQRVGNTINILGQSTSGGSILFDAGSTRVDGYTARAITHIDAHTVGGTDPLYLDGGSITLVAYGDILSNPSNVNNLFSAAGSSFFVPPPVFGSNGNVVVVSPGQIVLPKIDMAANLGGSISIRTAVPSNTSIDVTPNTLQSFGLPTIGNFQTGALTGGTYSVASQTTFNGSLSIATVADISMGNVDLRGTTSGAAGGNLYLQSGGNISVGTIDVSSNTTIGNAGTVTLISGSASAFNLGGGGSNGSGAITANAGTTSGDGGEITVRNTGSGGIFVSALPTTLVADGDGAGLTLDAGTGILNLSTLGSPTINRSAAGTDNAGGTIALYYSGLTIPAGNISLQANGTGSGSGGTVIVHNNAGPLTVGSNPGEFSIQVNGAAGTATVDLASTGAMLINTGWNFTETTTLRSGSTLTVNSSQFGKDVRMSANGTLIINAAITADPVTLTSTSDIQLNNNVTADGGILIVSGGNISTTLPNLQIDASSASGPGGNVVMAAGAAFTETDTDVTINGASSTGGSIDFTTGGGALSQITSASTAVNGTAGDITLLAFQGATANTGRIQSNAGSINASGTLTHGAISVLANHNTGTAISFLGAIGSAGSGTSGAAITVNAATPVVGTAGSILKSDASYSGTFTGGSLTGGSVSLNSVASGPGFIDVSTNGDLQIGSVLGVAPSNFNGPTVTLKSGVTSNFSVGNVGLSGSGTGSGGHLLIDAGSGTVSIGPILADSGNTGGDGGTVDITVRSASSFLAPTISVLGQGTASGGGSIAIRNLSTGGITLGAILNASGTGAGGDILLDAGSGALTATAGLSASANAGGSGFAAGDIEFIASSMTGTFISLFANNGAAGTGNIMLTTSGGNVLATSGSVFLVAGNNVELDLSSGNLNTSATNAGPIQITAGGAVLGAQANLIANSTGTNNDGGMITVSGSSGITLHDVMAKPNGTGNGGVITLTSASGAIQLNSIDSLRSNVSMTAGNGVHLTSKLDTAASLTLTINGGDAIFDAANNNIMSLTGFGSGTISLNNGSNPLNLGPIGTNQSVALSTTSATGITFQSGFNTTGTILLDTPTVTNSGSTITAASITIENLSGNLTVNGGAGAQLIGTTPAAGTPGNPSSPAAITFSTAPGANLNLFGNLTFTGDVFLNNPSGTTNSNPGSLYTGNNNITMKTLNWVQTGGGNIVANNLIFAGVSIINPTGDVTLLAPVTYTGRDVVIAAFGNVNLGNFNITTASSTTSGGDITMLAGFTFSPNTGGQTTSQTPYDITGFNPAGGSITGTGIIDSTSSFAGGNAGSVTAIAHLGAVSLGPIFAAASTGVGGDVSLYGGNGVSVGNINAGGGAGSGNVTASISEVQIVGTPVIDSGSVSAGLTPTGVKAAGTITVGAITAGANIAIEGLGPVNVNGALSANSITIDTDKTGFLTLTGVNNITATPDSGNDGGSITIDILNYVVSGNQALTLNANSNVGGDGGQITFTTTDTVNLGAFLILNATGTNSGGTISVETDYILNASGGINAAGSNGRGAVISLNANGAYIDLNNQAFLSQINGTGAAGDGGGISLIASSIFAGSTPSSPLALSSMGSGTGNGGSITYITNDTTTTYVGSNPAKEPKAPVNYVTFDARSGVSGGNGGNINVLTGGNLTVDPTAVQVGPRGTNGNGGFIAFEADNANGKTGNLIVLGNLSANGNGIGTAGAITLRSDSKKAFTIGGTKTPKNGIMGNINAGTTNGNVIVVNNAGGITVSASNAIASGNVSLTAGAKGSITQGKGVVISAGNALTMTTDAGNVGKKPLLVSAQNLFLNSSTGNVNVQDLVTGAITVSSNGVGGDLSVESTSGGMTVLTDLITSSGDITLLADTGTLRVNAGLNVQANNGALTLAALDTVNGDIDIQTGASVQTAGKGGQVVVAIGQPPKKGTLSTTPSNIAISEIGKGKVYFGPGGVVAPTPTATVVAMNKNVIFNNLSTNGKLITLGSGSLVKADPPVKSAAMSRGAVLGASSGPSVETAVSEILTGPMSTQLSNLNSVDLLATSNTLTASSTTSAALNNRNALINIATVDAQALSDTYIGIANSQTGGTLGTIGDAKNSNANTFTDSTIAAGVLTNAGESPQESATNDSGNLIIDALIHTNSGGQLLQRDEHKGVKINTVATAGGSKEGAIDHHVLSSGNVLFATQAETIVETTHGTVELAAGAIALIMQTKNALSVYDLHDQSKNAVVINTAGKRISLSPGRHVLISDNAQHGFAHANLIELVQYRNIKEAKHNNASVFTTEFAIPSVCYAVKPLKTLMASNHREANAIAKRIIKTTAVLSTIAPDKGDFVQFFKAQRTAMVN